MAEARGFYAKAERNLQMLSHASGSFTWATSWPVVFVAISGEAGGHCTVIDWHTERLARYCFYPRERFTLERPNSLELFVCSLLPALGSCLADLRMDLRTPAVYHNRWYALNMRKKKTSLRLSEEAQILI